MTQLVFRVAAEVLAEAARRSNLVALAGRKDSLVLRNFDAAVLVVVHDCGNNSLLLQRVFLRVHLLLQVSQLFLILNYIFYRKEIGNIMVYRKCRALILRRRISLLDSGLCMYSSFVCLRAEGDELGRCGALFSADLRHWRGLYLYRFFALRWGEHRRSPNYLSHLWQLLAPAADGVLLSLD